MTKTKQESVRLLGQPTDCWLDDASCCTFVDVFCLRYGLSLLMKVFKRTGFLQLEVLYEIPIQPCRAAQVPAKQCHRGVQYCYNLVLSVPTQRLMFSSFAYVLLKYDLPEHTVNIEVVEFLRQDKLETR
ncbi:unnamed protein product [Phytophthora fragariaefolia]|uniref:Unnamed protein product n=1 Tax=Phytophthora fragariaefolia TaxID=1490495 RepID=A0A9W7CL27_9STRA|nr:unnamed protein product [Phytophthora fragariaefolia]